MTIDPVQAVLDRLDCVKPTAKGQWSARCPAHDDRIPSLSIGVGDDQPVVFRCMAGCSQDDVLAALELTWADILGASDNGQQVAAAERRTPPPAAYPTFALAVAAAERQTRGKQTYPYDYDRANGDLHFRVVRFNLSKGKTFRPFHQTKRGWVQADPPGELSLYRLPGLLAADSIVHVGEGEGCAEALRNHLRVTATTSAHGNQSPHKSDWTPLAGRRVVVLPDADDAGRRYAQTVAGILTSLDPPATVNIVELPDLQEHGDIVDFIKDRRENGKDYDAIRAELSALAEQAPEWTPGTLATIDKVDGETALTAPKLDRAEADRKIKSIFKLGRSIVLAGIDLGCELRDFYEGGGLVALGDHAGPLPMSYIASGLGVTKQRVHQLIEAGRAWRVCVNFVDADMAGDMTEAHLRPLTRLEPDQQAKALASANALAREDHETKQAQRKADGRRPTRLRLKQKHVRQAVSEILGPAVAPTHTPVKRKPPANARALEIDGIRRRIEELAACTAGILGDGIPAGIRARIVALAEQDWCRE